ncbi:MAG: RDD family protein [Acidimicrobiales bacterium]
MVDDEPEVSPLGIVTPEAVVLEFDTGGAGSRVLAELIDLTLQVTALIVLAIAMSAVVSSVAPSLSWVAVVVFLVAGFLVLIGYPVGMETLWNGRTLGKAALGLRVVTVEGGPIRFRHAAIRGIIGLGELWALSGIPALVCIILSKRNQRLGDMVAGTLVLRERLASKRPAAVHFPAPPGMEAYVGSLDVGGLTTAQYGAVRSFLVRVGDLAPAARAAMAVRLANPVADRLHHRPPPMVGPELFLVCVAAAYQQRHAAADDPWLRPAGPVPGAFDPDAGAAGAYGPGGLVGPSAGGAGLGSGGFGEAGGAAPWATPEPVAVGSPGPPASWGGPASPIPGPASPPPWGAPGSGDGGHR